MPNQRMMQPCNANQVPNRVHVEDVGDLKETDILTLERKSSLSGLPKTKK